jgi:hypothetical protein
MNILLVQMEEDKILMVFNWGWMVHIIKKLALFSQQHWQTDVRVEKCSLHLGVILEVPFVSLLK